MAETQSDTGPLRSSAFAAGTRLKFGPFSLRNQGGALYRHDEPVRVGSRALQILAVLVARPTQVVSRDDLMAEVWPDTTVVENNLTVHVAALRRALGDGQAGVQYIVNVPGRGYRFVAPVREEPDVSVPSAPDTGMPELTNLPVRMRPAVGLSGAIDDVTAKLCRSHLVTVTGPAGVGKTTLAAHVAQAERARHPDGVWLVDLASLQESENIPAAIGAPLRIELGSGDATTNLVRALSGRKALLVLDNCEHLIEAVADLTTRILQQCRDIVVLATSREPLRVGGETIHNLLPLGMPPDATTLSAREALGYAAVELLVERVSSATNDFTLSDEEAGAATSICRHLDGLPLAIEFASALVGVFGITGLAARLDDRFKLLRTDMRGVADRHRTLTAALDWSFGLLDGDEQAGLRRLAVFAGSFTLEGAAAVMDLEDLGEAGGVLARLHIKSLITNDIASSDLRFRLLETTRVYALEKLEEAGEVDAARHRHAGYYTNVLKTHGAELRTSGVSQHLIDDVRRGLNWALSPSGDLDMAVALTVETLPIWIGLSQYVARVGRTLQRVRSRVPPDLDAEMQLMAILGLANQHIGVVSSETVTNWKSLNALAVERRHFDHQMLSLWGLWLGANWSGVLKKARECALGFFDLAEQRPNRSDRALAQLMLAQTEFASGNLAFASRHVEHGLALFAPPTSPWSLTRSLLDPHVFLLAVRTRLLWLQGFGDQARVAVQDCLEEARRHGHALTFSFALADAAIQITLLNGDLSEAEAWIAERERHAAELGIDDSAQRSTAALSMALRAARGDLHGGEALVAVKGWDDGFIGRFPALIGLLAQAVGTVALPENGLALIDRAFATVCRDPSHWCRPELLRARGVLEAMSGGSLALVSAEAILQEAQDLASARGALAWELRIAMSSVELSSNQGKLELAGETLARVLARYTEGFAAADYVRGNELQARLTLKLG